MLEARKCMMCKKVLKGRTDKKFCNELCRNRYNNSQRIEKNNYVRSINAALKKNRRVLQQLLPPTEKTVTVDKAMLQLMGFHFLYHTHTFTNKEGKIYSYCYEYGYLRLESDRYLIVKRIEK
jgi:hypothetical protein